VEVRFLERKDKEPLPKVLVTGGTGFLGSHLLRRLLDSGDSDLRVLDISKPAELAKEVELIEGSITSPEDVARALKGIERVYHLAGKVSRNLEDKPAMYAVHVEGTRVLCQEARKAGVERIVISSTSGTIAVTEDGKEIPDETWPAPIHLISRWPYYTSKLYQEELARRETKDGPELILVHPSLLLGPGDVTLSSSEDVLRFLAKDVLAIPPGGLSFVDARDAAQGLMLAMQGGKNGERYLLGGPNWTFETFFGRLERMTKVKGPRLRLPDKLYGLAGNTMDALYEHWGKKPPVDKISMEMGRYFWYVDCSKAKRELGFAARDPGETLYDTVAYIREHFLGNGALR
jgi:dihydroflavonol-4-reductase